MPDVVKRWEPDDNRSFTCAEPVLGGQLVERRSGTDLVGVAGANSVHVVGVALHDVPATRATIQGPQVGDGYELTVIRGFTKVTFSGSAVEGDKLVAAAGGQVAAAGAAPDARMIVGEADEAAANGQVKRARIY
jgi:hypothetical protein